MNQSEMSNQEKPPSDTCLDDEIDTILDACLASETAGRSRWPGMTYEQGVSAAIFWLRGLGNNPMDD